MSDAMAAINLSSVQKQRKRAVLVLFAVLIVLTLVSQSWGGVEGEWHESVEAAGLISILAAVIGRAWCSLYIGGRKTAELVASGPYSVTRNPLYVFSFIGAFGVGAQSGSVTIGLLFTLASLAIFHLTVRKEEAWLSAKFGDAYADYCRRTPRFLPRPALWRDEQELVIRPVFFLTTLRDGLVFLLAVPLFEIIDLAQAEGWLRVIARLP